VDPTNITIKSRGVNAETREVLDLYELVITNDEGQFV
jgi:hypothetical protein